MQKVRKEEFMINKIKTSFKKTKEILLSVFITIYFMLLTSFPVYAEGVQDSKLAKGTEKLITDLTTWLMILSPVVVGVLIIYFFIRRSAADDMDQKRWNNRIVVAIVSCIGAVIASATLNLLIGYYK